MDEPDANLETPQTSEHSDELSTPDNFCEESDGLRMSREAMLELARRAAGGIDENSLREINRTVLARIFWEDRAFISSTLLHGTFSLRMCIVNHNTTWDDVRETLEAAEQFGSEAVSARKDS